MKIYPYLQGISVEYVWGGTLDFTHDRMPHAGELDDLFFSAGYAGHGVALATYLGSLGGQALCGDQVDNPFAITPISRAPLGLHFAVRPLLPVVAAWHWLQDRIS